MPDLSEDSETPVMPGTRASWEEQRRAEDIRRYKALGFSDSEIEDIIIRVLEDR